MKYVLLLLLMFSVLSHADFVDLSQVRKQQGPEAACQLALIQYGETTSNFEKTYYKKKISACDRKADDYKSLSREEKKKRIRSDYDAAMVHLRKALDNKEDVNYKLLERILVEADKYPEINEGLTKLKIEFVRNKKQEVPDVNEGDVHEIGPYIYGEYADMANAYIMNGMFDDADRIIREYGQTIAGESGEARLIKRTESFKAKFEKKMRNAINGIKPKIDPEKVTAQLRKASEELSHSPKAVNVIKAEVQAKVQDQLVLIWVDSIFEKNWKYILALFIVIGLYFYSRRKTKK